MKRVMAGFPVQLLGCGLTTIVRGGVGRAVIIEGPARTPPVAAYCVRPVKKAFSKIGDVCSPIEKCNEAAKSDQTIRQRVRSKEPTQAQGVQKALIFPFFFTGPRCSLSSVVGADVRENRSD